jgi:hypothetical protein
MLNVKDFGAIGDGRANETAAIQRAIDAGGMVAFPPGVYLSGSLFLKSGGGLYLEQGAVLLASPSPADYLPPPDCPANWASQAESSAGLHFINAVGQHDITLAGDGCINGNSPAFLNEMDPEVPIWFKRIWRPGQMIFLCDCENVSIRGLRLQDAPYWHCHLFGCRKIRIHGLEIRGDRRVPNNDGIDLDCCEDAVVTGCLIETGDDSLAIRCDSRTLGRPQPCRNIVVSQCVLASGYANAIRVGVGAGTVRDCLFSQCVVRDSRTGFCIVSKYSDNETPGGTLRNLQFRQFHCQCERLFNIKLDNVPDLRFPSSATIENLAFSEITGEVTLTSQIIGNGRGTIRALELSELDLDFQGDGPAPNVNAQGGWGRASTDVGFEVSRASDIRFDGCRIRFKDVPGWTAAIRADRPDAVAVDRCRSNRPLR